MLPKTAKGSKNSSKEARNASRKSKPIVNQFLRKSPRNSSKAKIGLTQKLISERAAHCKKVPTTKGALTRAERQNSSTRPGFSAVKPDADRVTQGIFDHYADYISPIYTPLPKATIIRAKKTEEDVKQIGQVLEPQQFKLGLIISVASHEEVYQDPKNKLKLQPTREQTLTHLGWVYSKARKIVVMSRFAQHLVGLPIFSHGGKGLEKKERSEFVGIRDIQYFKRTPTDSFHPHLLSHRLPPFTRVAKNHWSVINSDSYVQFTRPLSFAYNTRCTIEGHLRDQDLHSLINLANSKRPSFSANPAARTAPKLRFKTSGG
ncbi:hypothetical protein IFR04_005751 [Cadophora malorum]|uniref:DUF6590 domain-containing protein n=1 Tax=Cadophora malorum TaxID=108018 RepID=A0A8H7WB27_9HELO|nr:hypothetical protein IFR04_005751 [Cadophora malorum]